MPLIPSPIDTEAVKNEKSSQSNEGETKSIINLQLHLNSAAANKDSKDEESDQSNQDAPSPINGLGREKEPLIIEE